MNCPHCGKPIPASALMLARARWDKTTPEQRKEATARARAARKASLAAMTDAERKAAMQKARNARKPR